MKKLHWIDENQKRMGRELEEVLGSLLKLMK